MCFDVFVFQPETVKTVHQSVAVDIFDTLDMCMLKQSSQCDE